MRGTECVRACVRAWVSDWSMEDFGVAVPAILESEPPARRLPVSAFATIQTTATVSGGSFLPRMASELFVQDFLPYALALAGDDPERMAPWDGAITTFREKVAEAGLGGGASGDE